MPAVRFTVHQHALDESAGADLVVVKVPSADREGFTPGVFGLGLIGVEGRYGLRHAGDYGPSLGSVNRGQFQTDPLPDRATYDIHEDDDGTYAVVWAGTGAVARIDGAPQRGLDVERANAAADHLEALERIAAVRKGRSDA